MSNGFDCNIPNTAANKINQKHKKEKQSEFAEQKEDIQMQESASLNFQPSAIAGKAMIGLNIPDQNSQIVSDEEIDFGVKNKDLNAKLNKLVKEYGKELFDKAVRISGIDFGSDSFNEEVIKNLGYSLMLDENLINNLSDVEIDIASKISRQTGINLLSSATSLLYRGELKELNEDEIPKFIDWIEFCNIFAQNDTRIDYYIEENSDRKNFGNNVSQYFENPAIRENTAGCIELINNIKDDFSSKEQLTCILKKELHGKSAQDIVETNIALKLLDNFYSVEDTYYSIDRNKIIDGKISKVSKRQVFYAESKNIIKLRKISEKFNLDIKVPILMSKKEKEGHPVSDEHLDKVYEEIKDIKTQNSFTGEMVKRMILDEEKFEHYNKWLHYIDENIKTDLHKLENTQKILFNIVFSYDGTKFDKYLDSPVGVDEKTVDGCQKTVSVDKLSQLSIDNCFEDVSDKFIEMYLKLSQNTEILDAIRNFEIDISNGISLGKKIDRNSLITKEDSQKNTQNILKYKKQENQLYLEEFLQNCTKDCLLEHIMKMSNKHSFNDMAFSLCGIRCDVTLMEILSQYTKNEIMSKLNIIDAMKQKTYKHHKLYLNGEHQNKSIIESKIEDFYDRNSIALLKLVSIFDKETIDLLMRKRFNAFESYLNDIKSLDNDNTDLLKKMVDSLNIDGKPFMPTQKIEFIDILLGYINNNLGLEKVKQMVSPENSGRVDLAQLKIDLFNKVMKNTNLTDEEIASIPKEKLVSWDLKKVHLLAKSINASRSYYHNSVFDNIIRAASLHDFESYINDETNIYGKANAMTKQMYKDLNLNYEKWVHPSKEHETDFVSVDSNREQLSQIACQIVEDMNVLMQTPVKVYIKKQYPEFVKDDKFILPNNYMSNKDKLLNLVENLIDSTQNGQMYAVWSRAEKNALSSDNDKNKMAHNTLTIKSHLEQRYKDLECISSVKVDKNIDWKIKMWDRIPQKDLFQGNYSTCCIGMGESNGSAMPHYIMNTAYNMIEIVDNKSGDTVGNALCYFVKREDGKPVFVIDNIEINTSLKPSNVTGKRLRAKLADYAANIAKDVTGMDDVIIYLGGRFNDVPCEDLPKDMKTITFWGDIDCNRIYMDMFGKPAQWTNKEDFTDEREVLVLKE